MQAAGLLNPASSGRRLCAHREFCSRTAQGQPPCSGGILQLSLLKIHSEDPGGLQVSVRLPLQPLLPGEGLAPPAPGLWGSTSCAQHLTAASARGSHHPSDGEGRGRGTRCARAARQGAAAGGPGGSTVSCGTSRRWGERRHSGGRMLKPRQGAACSGTDTSTQQSGELSRPILGAGATRSFPALPALGSPWPLRRVEPMAPVHGQQLRSPGPAELR